MPVAYWSSAQAGIAACHKSRHRGDPAEQHRAISRQWTQRPDIWRLQQPLALTAAEQRWLQQHGSVRVGFNPFAPLALLDGRNQFQGISAELLQIHLRTGINFVAVPGIMKTRS